MVPSNYILFLLTTFVTAKVSIGIRYLVQIHIN